MLAKLKVSLRLVIVFAVLAFVVGIVLMITPATIAGN
jgi:hypothetical protein